jgi:hypothetical protein
MYKYINIYIGNILYIIFEYFNNTNNKKNNIIIKKDVLLINSEKNNIKPTFNNNLLDNIQNDFEYIDLYIDNDL